MPPPWVSPALPSGLVARPLFWAFLPGGAYPGLAAGRRSPPPRGLPIGIRGPGWAPMAGYLAGGGIFLPLPELKRPKPCAVRGWASGAG